jgi:hypothetical protein
MPKSAAQRKAAQRARQSASGDRKIELLLDAQEVEMLRENWPSADRSVNRMAWMSISPCSFAKITQSCKRSSPSSQSVSARSAEMHYLVTGRDAHSSVKVRAGKRWGGMRQNWWYKWQDM